MPASPLLYPIHAVAALTASLTLLHWFSDDAGADTSTTSAGSLLTPPTAHTPVGTLVLSSSSSFDHAHPAHYAAHSRALTQTQHSTVEVDLPTPMEMLHLLHLLLGIVILFSSSSSSRISSSRMDHLLAGAADVVHLAIFAVTHWDTIVLGGWSLISAGIGGALVVLLAMRGVRYWSMTRGEYTRRKDCQISLHAEPDGVGSRSGLGQDPPPSSPIPITPRKTHGTVRRLSGVPRPPDLASSTTSSSPTKTHAQSTSISPTKSPRGRLIRQPSLDSWTESPSSLKHKLDQLHSENDRLLTQLEAHQRQSHLQRQESQKERNKLLAELKRLADDREAAILEAETVRLDVETVNQLERRVRNVMEEKAIITQKLISSERNLEQRQKEFGSIQKALEDKIQSKSEGRRAALAEVEAMRTQLAEMERLRHSHVRAEERIAELVAEGSRQQSSERTLSELLDKERLRNDEQARAFGRERRMLQDQLAAKAVMKTAVSLSKGRDVEKGGGSSSEARGVVPTEMAGNGIGTIREDTEREEGAVYGDTLAALNVAIQTEEIAERHRYQNQIADLTAKLEATTNERDQARERYEDTLTNERRLKDLIDSEKELTAKLEIAVGDTTATVEGFRSKVDELAKERDALILKNKALKKSVQDKLVEIKETFAEEFAKSKDMTEERLSALLKEKNDALSRIKSLEKERDFAVSNRASLESELYQTAAEHKQSRQQIEKLEDRIVEYQLMMTSLEEANDKAETKLLQLSGLNGDEIFEVSKERDSLREKVQDLQQILKARTKQLHDASTLTDSFGATTEMKLKLADMESKASAQKRHIEELEAKISELKSSRAASEESLSKQNGEVKGLKILGSSAKRAQSVDQQQYRPKPPVNIVTPESKVEDENSSPEKESATKDRQSSKWAEFQEELNKQKSPRPTENTFNASFDRPGPSANGGDYGPRRPQSTRKAAKNSPTDKNNGRNGRADSFNLPANHYETLEVLSTASLAEIKKAYRKLAKEHHPDMTNNCPKSEEIFKSINKAYAVLSDSDERKKYDADNWFS